MISSRPIQKLRIEGLLWTLRHHLVFDLGRNARWPTRRPMGLRFSRKAARPRFEVMMMMVFLKSTVFAESVGQLAVLQNTCSRMLYTSGCCLFRIFGQQDDGNTGARLTRSVSCPPSS